MIKPQVVNAAVAVLLRDDGQVLLAERPADKNWAGWWEFPGGKIEAGETPLAALQRELDEELGTQASLAYSWLTRSFAYPERTVKLHFFIVRQWTAIPHGREGQQLSWQNPAALTVGPLLPANVPLLAALQLPAIYAITDMSELGERVFLRNLQQALEQGLRLVQVREKHLSRAELRVFAARVIELARPYSTRVLINTDIELARELGADGVHMPAALLMQIAEKPQDLLCAASCHNSDEMQKAAALELDFVLLSPVLPTQSHTDAVTLGWPQFGRLIVDFPLPVYALGGLQREDLTVAWQHGAHGIAMQRSAWHCQEDVTEY